MTNMQRADTPVLFQQLYSTPEAADALGTTRQTIARRVKNGTMHPAHTSSSGHVFTYEEIERARRTNFHRRPHKRSRAA